MNLNNREDAVFNRVEIIKLGTNQRLNIETSINQLNTTVANTIGLPPETLNNLQKISTAINDDPMFFTNINADIDKKQDKIILGTSSTNSKNLLNTTTSKLKNIVGVNLTLAEDDNNLIITAIDSNTKQEIIDKIQSINTEINKKQNTLSNGAIITGSKSLLLNNKIKNIVGVNLTLTEDDNNLTITATDSNTKQEIIDKIQTINTEINKKQNTLSNTTEATMSKTLLINNKIKNLISGDKITLTSTDESITINGIDSYTKAETAAEIGKVVGLAPEAMNTLKEIADIIGDNTSITGTLISLISNKANSSDTFKKTILNVKDVYLDSGNKQIVSIENTNANNIIFNIKDTVGTAISDNIIEAFKIEMNPQTKQISCYIPHKLIVNSINIIDELATKISTSNTFVKTILNNDVYLTLSANKRIVATSTANQFKFQINDNQGTIFTDAWIDVATMDFNIAAKKAKLTVKDSLFVDSTDILTTLNNKVSYTDYRMTQTAVNFSSVSLAADNITPNGAYNFINTGTDALSIKVDSSTISAAFLGPNAGAQKGNVQFYKDVNITGDLKVGTTNILTQLNNKLSSTDPKITQSAVNFSSVSFESDGITPNGAYNFINTGTDTLSIKVDSSTISAAFFGPNAGTQKGNVQFYKDVNITGDLKVGTTNILTQLNNKLSSTDPKITQSAVNFSSVSFESDGITPNGAYNFINTGTDTLSIKVDSSTISAAFFGPNAGSQKGNVQFYKDVNITGALKVGTTNILTELATKTSLTNTFEKTILNNDVYLTFSNNKRIVATATGNQIKFQINDNQGTIFTDAWIDVATMDFNITTKKAKLTVKDSLFVDAIDIITTLNNKVNTTALSSYANLTTTTLQSFLSEIKAPIITLGNTNLLNTAASWTSGASNATHTLNVGPNWLSVNTPNRVAFEVMGAINGVADEGQTQFFYNVTVPKLTVQTEGLNSMGDLTISRSAPTGNGNVKTSIINSGQDGFSSLYLNTTNQTINETGQLFVGQQSGLTLMTRSNHPIQFKAYSDQPLTTVPTSIKILSNTTRDVEIYTPLKIKSTTSTIIESGLVVNGNLSVLGTTTFTQANPHWIAVMIVYLGGVPSIGRNGGRYPITGLSRVSGFPAGVFQFDFPEHPFGAGYIVNITASAGYGTIYNTSRSGTRFGVTTRNISNVLFDTETHILISAY